VSLRDEIREQPDALRRQLKSSDAGLEALAARLSEAPVETVVIAARGTSDHAAIYGQYVLGVRNGLSVGLATPSIVSLYDADPKVGRSLVVGISQSGASPDIVGVVAAARRQGAPTLAITNDPASALAREAEFVLELAAGPELAIAATKTYTTSLLAIARLSLALDPEPAADAALAAIPESVTAALALEPEVEAIASALAAEDGGFDRTVIVGRGFEYATAREWALKLKELARVFADPYSSADFRHGPIALVQPGIPVLVLAPTGEASEGQLELLRDLAERGVETVVASDDEAALALGRWSVPIPAAVPEWLRPIVSIVPAQLFAYHATRARGLDPDAPRYISKVTRTV
jgi:glucosamine--fructose-6-phosphate aminotransferase (isomerizing)